MSTKTSDPVLSIRILNRLQGQDSIKEDDDRARRYDYDRTMHTQTIAPDVLLRWYLDAGVDEVIGDSPYQPSVAPTATEGVASSAVVPSPMVAGNPKKVLTGPHPATACQTLDALRQAMATADGIPLRDLARSTVFADGNPNADLMVIGEAPGQEEDHQGLPFVGRSGRLLDRMLASIGRDRSTVYISNILPWRPPDNRKPTPDEVAVCLPFLVRHIELIGPKALFLLGGSAAQALLARTEGITRLRGQWFEFSSPGLARPVPVMTSFHPAYLLRTPAAKRQAWQDIRQLARHLGIDLTKN